ncbi:MAG: hypothetical protein RLZZ373_1082 [Pseudomonadota bacterium]
MATRRAPPQQERHHSWRFVRQLTVGDVLNFIGIVLFIGIPFLAWARAMEARVLTLENLNASAVKADTERDANTREQRVLFNGRMEKIEEKLGSMQVDIARVLAGQQEARRDNPRLRR